MVRIVKSKLSKKPVKQTEYIKKIDRFVGDKIYISRLGKGLSREGLAETIGVTQQQLQKYEKGINRISVGRLVLIANRLGESIDSFLVGLNSEETDIVFETQHQRACIEMARNFMKIPDSEQQMAVSSLVRSLAKKENQFFPTPLLQKYETNSRSVSNDRQILKSSV